MGKLEGKILAFLGSSVTWGHNGWSIVEALSDAEKCVCVKEAVSGTTLADINEDSYVSRLNRLDGLKHADVFICQLSTNDATRELPLGEISDTPDTLTITGAIENIVTRVKEKWNCPILFYTNPKYPSENYARMAERLAELSEKHGFGIIDLWNNAAFDSVPEDWMQDPIHPTRKGYTLGWLPVFRAAIENVIK